MTMAFELRPGLRVRYRPSTAPEEWREGTLARASANGEEWLVKNEFGQFWLALSKIAPLPETELV